VDSRLTLEIIPFQRQFGSAALALIVGIQRDEFAIDITADQQPDLHDIPAFYQVRGGNFWVAVVDGRVVGTIALLDIGNQKGALRKMFVHPDFRGPEAGTATRLLATLFAWARDSGVGEIFLGTTAKFTAAHRFYAKSGFSEIAKSELPPAFPVMSVDTRFFHRRVEVAG
jgi:N-acetylglutamate synthase-like GNAT family acetyltransferase